MKTRPSSVDLFTTFFKIGFFTFGGGLAMIPFIQAEFTTKNKWLTQDDMVDIIALSQSLPGIIAINSSIFIGLRLRGLPGALMAALGTILPAFLSIIAILVVLVNFEENFYVQKVFTGIKATSAALILDTVIRLVRSSLKNRFAWAMAAITFLLITIFNVNAAWGILIGALSGWIWFVYIKKI
ncbi:chromate transporter [Breznakibacter xylanolyticus]|nr:chromate transporter [Breznakibacter xylanolyticus]